MEPQHRKNTEYWRKLIHISSIIIPLGYRYLLPDKRIMLTVLIPLTIIAFVIEILRLENRTFKRNFFRFFGIILRRSELKNFSGATYLLASSVFCIAFFSRDIAFLALSSLAIGDTFAAIVGISYGKRKIRGTNKSVEGSLACFLSTFIYGLFFVSPILAFVSGIITTYSETSRLPIDDNLKIPIFSGLVMSVVNIFI
ncbi:MAG: SEC59/DGK1/VTE5 family protein [Candidatus Cloacimonetes bacterium]|nr:SEC59/DGK1/VTE5 family protein [Candidatus Cloacimonadota bacterium]